MARGDRVGNGERVVRYVKPSSFDGATVLASAFELRPDEDGLSVHRRAFFDADPGRDLMAIRTAITGRGFTMKANGGLAEIGVADVDSVSDLLGLALSVLEEPLDASGAKAANPAHAEVYGLPLPGIDPSDLRAQRAGNELARRCAPIHPTR